MTKTTIPVSGDKMINLTAVPRKILHILYEKIHCLSASPFQTYETTISNFQLPRHLHYQAIHPAATVKSNTSLTTLRTHRTTISNRTRHPQSGHILLKYSSLCFYDSLLSRNLCEQARKSGTHPFSPERRQIRPRAGWRPHRRRQKRRHRFFFNECVMREVVDGLEVILVRCGGQLKGQPAYFDWGVAILFDFCNNQQSLRCLQQILTTQGFRKFHVF